MNGLPNIASRIPVTQKSAVERGLPGGSFFRVVFPDGSLREEHDTSWGDMSERRTVKYFGQKKTVYTCTFPVKRLEMFHDGMEAIVDVPEDCQVFQSVQSRQDFGGGSGRNTVVGRRVGIVRGDSVIEERFLNGVNHEVLGSKI